MTLTTTITAGPEPAAALPTARIAVAEVRGAAASRAWARSARYAAGGTVFHDPAWCTAVERTFGHLPLHRVATRGGTVVGVLPLMEVRSLLGGRMLVSVPYGNYGGVLAEDESVRRAANAELTRRIGVEQETR